MKKTKDITKYNLKWQIVRSKIKGSGVSVDDKLKYVEQYFNEEQSIDSYERVLNYLEGLSLGYKNKDNTTYNYILHFIEKFKKININNLRKETNDFITPEESVNYSYKERLDLWKDLFIRNKKWLEKGYNQKEINDFMDVLYTSFKNELIPSNYSYGKLLNLRSDADKMDNTHRFIY